MNTLKDLKNKLENEIRKSSHVFVIGHNGPDLDAIGSAIGLCTLANYYKRPASIIVNDEPSKIDSSTKKVIDDCRDNYSIIDKETALEKANSNSLLILTDVNKTDMISLGDDVYKFKKIIIIDHHSENNNTVKTNDKFIREDISSASEIVTTILNMLKIQYNSTVANYLLAGINLDTKRFKQNVTEDTHDTAEKLLHHGADIDYVNNLFLEEFESFCRISNLIINGTIIKKYSESELTPIQVSFTLDRNNPKSIYRKEDYAKAADRMMKFNGIDASFALGFVEPGVVHISARSTKKVNVGSIMNRMHGGGNPQSAGGRVTTDNLLSLENELMKLIPIGLSDQEDIIDEPPVIKRKQIKRK